MNPIFQLASNLLPFFSTLIKRLRHYWSTSLSAEIGIISVLSLIICIPIFTNAVLSDVLRQELLEKSLKNHRSLFSIHAYYSDNALYTPLAFDDAEYVSQWLDKQLTHSMGVKVKRVYMETSTKPLVWKPIRYASSKPPFVDIHLSFMTSEIVPEKTRLVEGFWPVYNPDDKTAPDPIPVAVYEGFADEKFINVGDIYQISNPNLRIEVVGIFRTIDQNDLDWFYSPETTFSKEVWVPKEYFQIYLSGIFDRLLDNVSWYAIVDETSLRFTNSKTYSRSMMRLNTTLVSILPKIKIDYSPLDQLVAYESRMHSMVTFFYIVGAPMILLSLIFISLTSSIAIEQLEQETVTMRGRGISFSIILLQNLVESLLLILMAIPISILIGWFAATMIGKAQSFLQFSANPSFSYSLKDILWLWFFIMAVFIVIARVLPILNIRRTTVVKVKQERSRSSNKPFWQRFYLDFLILVFAIYTYWRLRHQLSQLKLLSVDNAPPPQGQYDPVQFIASSLFIIAACMIALRIFPLLLRFLRAIIDRGFPVGPFLAIQETSRRPQASYNVMLLIMISLGIAIYSTSMAKTFNHWVYDSQYYRTGADLIIKEYEIPLDSGANSTIAGGSTQSDQIKEMNGVESLIDIQKHLQLPDIHSATLVGKYNGSFNYGSGNKECVLMGIDRLSFPDTAYFRADFANLSLGEMMNTLAEQPNGVLVAQNLLDNTGLHIGDRIRATAPIGLYKQGFNAELAIVGTYKYFPTIYPADVPTLIVNTETLFGYPEAATGYDVWLNINKDANVQDIIKSLKSLALVDQLLVDVRGNAIQEIQKLTSQPEWLGLFGILSVGFILTGLLPCIGFILDSFANLRKNFIQLGILQAIGLSVFQLINYLVLERLIIIMVAFACGLGIGYLTSTMFIPLLQISVASGTPVPPFQVLFGWTETTYLMGVFGIVFLIAILGTIGYMVQIKIFQAVKMGELI